MPATPGHKSLSHGLTRLIGATAALVLLAVSAAMNYLFLSSLGKTPLEGQVLGAASASADLLKAVLPFLILWAWRAGRYAVAVPGLLVWIVFTVFSLLSAIGFAAGNREAVSDVRAATAQRYDTVRSELDAATQERARLPEHRAAAIVAEAIQSQKQHRRWTSTKGCRNATVPKSRAYCREYFALRAELAAARKDAALAAKIERLRDQAQVLRSAGGKREPEPQISLLSRVLGLGHNPVRLALILLIAGLVELGAGLGLFLALSGSDAGQRKRADQASPPRGKRKPKALSSAQHPDGTVEDFAWACLRPAMGNTVSDKALLAAYRRWCDEKSFCAMDGTRFAQSFAALARMLGLRRGANGYEGIAVTAPPAMNNRIS